LKSLIRNIAFLIFAGSFFCQVYGQTLFLNKFTSDDKAGLPQNSIYSLLKDSDGFIWIGTEGGLSKFDGKVFQNFGVKDGLAAPHITYLFEDSKGNLWVGTTLGLSKRQGNDFVSFTMQDGLSENYIYCIAEDQSGGIWIGTLNGGATLYFNGAFSKIQEAQGLTAKSINDIALDNEGSTWFSSTGQGAFRYKDNSFEQFTTKNGLLSDSVFSMHVRKNGELVLGTLKGISIYKDGNFKNYGLKLGLFEDAVTQIVEDNYQHLWFTYQKEGVVHFDGNVFTRYTEKNGLPNNSVRSALEDIRGDIWFGTSNGLVRYPAERFEILRSNDNAKDRIVYAISEDRSGNIWFAEFGYGVFKFRNNKITSYTTKEGLVEDNVGSIFNDKDGNIWFGTLGGVSKWDGAKFSNITLKNGLLGEMVFSVIQDNDGNMWFSGEGGVAKYDGNKLTTFTDTDGLAPGWIYGSYLDTKGNIWFGSSDGGVSMFNGRRFITYTKEDGLPGNAIFSIMQDKYGTFWFTSEGSGIYRFDGEEFYNYNTADGLSSDICYSIIEDAGYLYVSTTRGITRIEYNAIEDKGRDAFKKFTNKQGLPSVEMTQGGAFKDSKGYLWFGTHAGIAKFDPKKKPNLYPPQIHLTTVKIVDSTYFLDTLQSHYFDLSHTQSDLRFDFIGIDFDSPDQMIYQYRMQGLQDTTWRETSERYVPYPFLPAGDYQFEVRARNGDGLYSAIPARLSFTINPPFYATWWFTTLIVLIGISSVYVLYVVKTRQVKRRNLELALMVKERTKELQLEKEKSDELLLNILPESCVIELKEAGVVQPRDYKNTSILFTDFKGFTYTASVLPADKLVKELNEIFKGFDDIVGRYGLEKLKTIGDAYMAACGLPEEDEHHAINMVLAATAMQDYMKERGKTAAIKWDMRAGIHSGMVIAGVVGTRKFTYDIWGDTVNVAARMESSGEPGEVNISAFTYMLIKDYFFCEYRGKHDAKNKGKMDMYFVRGIKPDSGIDPTRKFVTAQVAKEIVI